MGISKACSEGAHHQCFSASVYSCGCTCHLTPVTVHPIADLEVKIVGWSIERGPVWRAQCKICEAHNTFDTLADLSAWAHERHIHRVEARHGE